MIPATAVLWLCGPSSVGKTTIGWQHYCELSRSGVRAGTSGVPAGQAGELVRHARRDWPGFTGALEEIDTLTGPANADVNRQAASGGRVVLLSGVTGVGKSTIGFELYTRALRACHTAAYIDLDQVGFIGPAAGGGAVRRYHVKTCNVAALWRTYRAVGATHLVAVGQIEATAALHAYRQVLPEATLVTHKLTTLYAVAALNIFHWFAFPVIVHAVSGIESPDWRGATSHGSHGYLSSRP